MKERDAKPGLTLAADFRTVLNTEWERPGEEAFENVRVFCVIVSLALLARTSILRERKMERRNLLQCSSARRYVRLRLYPARTGRRRSWRNDFHFFKNSFLLPTEFIFWQGYSGYLIIRRRSHGFPTRITKNAWTFPKTDIP